MTNEYNEEEDEDRICGNCGGHIGDDDRCEICDVDEEEGEEEDDDEEFEEIY
jgi:hypothetical protein